MYDSSDCSFIRIKKPPKQQKCPVSGTNPTITSMEESFAASAAARGPSCSSNIVSGAEISESLNISCEDYEEVRKAGEDHILLDVRVKEQFDLCSLPGAINIPLRSLPDRMEEISNMTDGSKPIFCICRRGIASVRATNIIAKAASEYPNLASIKNVSGGLNSWRSKVDGTFPKY